MTDVYRIPLEEGAFTDLLHGPMASYTAFTSELGQGTYPAWAQSQSALMHQALEAFRKLVDMGTSRMRHWPQAV